MLEWLLAGLAAGVGAAVAASWLHGRGRRTRKKDDPRLFSREEWDEHRNFYDAYTVDFERMEMRMIAGIVGDSFREARTTLRRLDDGRWQAYKSVVEQAEELRRSIADTDRWLAEVESDGAERETAENDRAEFARQLEALNRPDACWIPMDHYAWVGALETAYQRYLRTVSR